MVEENEPYLVPDIVPKQLGRPRVRKGTGGQYEYLKKDTDTGREIWVHVERI